jgi:hypothetical protein
MLTESWQTPVLLSPRVWKPQICRTRRHYSINRMTLYPRSPEVRIRARQAGQAETAEGSEIEQFSDLRANADASGSGTAGLRDEGMTQRHFCSQPRRLAL